MFKLIKIEGGRINVPETRKAMAAAGTYHPGMLLSIASGKLSPATGDVKAVAVCMQEMTLAADGELLVGNVYPDMVFEVPITAFSASVQVPGASVTFSNGESVTATAATAGNGAMVESVMNAAAAGDSILVRIKA